MQTFKYLNQHEKAHNLLDSIKLIFKSMGYTLDGETGNWIKEEDI